MARVKYNNLEFADPIADEDNWEDVQNNNLKNLSNGSMHSYLIPLVHDGGTSETQWNIVEGDSRNFGAGVYTQQEWDIAYNNKIGIQKALEYAASNGFSKVKFPRGHYNTLYTNYGDDGPINRVDLPNAGEGIVLPSHLDIDGSHSTISVMFSSDYRNPYDNGVDYETFQLPGNIFSFRATYGTSLKNMTLLGEMYERTFTDPDEKAVELNTAVWFSKGSKDMECQSVIGRGFSGDPFSSMTDHDPANGTYLNFTESRTLFPNLLNTSDGTMSSKDGCYTTAMLDLDRITGDSIMMRTNIGHKRFPDFVNQTFYLCWYDENDVFITGDTCKYLNTLKKPVGAKKIKIGIYGEIDKNIDTDTIRISIDSVVDSADYTITINGQNYTVNSGVGATVESVAELLKDSINLGNVFKGATVSGSDIRLRDLEDGQLLDSLSIDSNMSRYVYKTYQITPPAPSGLLLYGCTMTENNRGGVSNLCNDTVIDRCTVFNNGLGARQGWPEFPDTTRYQFNFEDVISNSITIKNCNLDDSFNGMLLSALRIVVRNCEIMNSAGISIYNAESAYLYSNTFTNCTRVFGFTGDIDERNIHFFNNTSYESQFMDTSSRVAPNTFVINRDNVVHGSHLMYVVNPNEAYRCVLKNIIHYETYYNGTSALDSKLQAVFDKCKFNLTEPRVSSSALDVTSYKGSSFEVVCSYSDKRITPVGENNGLTLNGGRLYKELGVNETDTVSFNDCDLKVSMIECPEYGTNTDSVSNHTFDFYNTGIELTESGRLFKFSTSSGNNDGETNVIINIDLQGKSIVFGEGVGGDIFHFGHIGSNHNVTVNIKNGTIDLSKTSESVDIGYRSSGWTNEVTVNKTNVKILGTLNESVAGYNVVTISENIDDSIIGKNGNIGVAISDPKSKLDIDGGVKIGDDSDAASSDKVGTIRHRSDANNSYVEMCMQTGASTYAWEIIKQNTW